MKQLFIQKLGKKLTGPAMKQIKGGAITGGLWVCVVDYYRCYATKGTCLTKCSDPQSCQWYPYCP